MPDLSFEAPNLIYWAIPAFILLLITEALISANEEQDRPTYGLRKDIDTYNPFRIAFHEWADIWRDVRRPLPWKARLLDLFGPPGWSHDGSRRTTKELRAALRRQEVLRNQVPAEMPPRSFDALPKATAS